MVHFTSLSQPPSLGLPICGAEIFTHQQKNAIEWQCEQAGGSCPVNSQRPFEMAQPCHLDHLQAEVHSTLTWLLGEPNCWLEQDHCFSHAFQTSRAPSGKEQHSLVPCGATAVCFRDAQSSPRQGSWPHPSSEVYISALSNAQLLLWHHLHSTSSMAHQQVGYISNCQAIGELPCWVNG